MLKKEFTQYPHHTDPYAKHRITDEELDFLYELQKEMNTQHSDMLTYPRIWVIQEPIKNYLDNVETDLRNDPDAVEYLNQIADGADICELILLHHGTHKYRTLTDEQISDFAKEYFQILMAADIYDALISDRVYRRAIDHDRALDIVAENPEIKRWVFLALEKISLC